MIRRNSIVKFWLIFAVVLAVALAAIYLAYRWHRIFPTDEVSEIYTRYAETEGINAAYVKDYRVNDTVLVNVTMLEVSDSAVWEQVCEDLHLLTTEQIPEELRERFLSKNVFGFYIEQDTVMEEGNPRYLKTVYVYTRHDRTVCVFHSVNDVQYDAIMGKKIDEISN